MSDCHYFVWTSLTIDSISKLEKALFQAIDTAGCIIIIITIIAGRHVIYTSGCRADGRKHVIEKLHHSIIGEVLRSLVCRFINYYYIC